MWVFFRFASFVIIFVCNLCKCGCNRVCSYSHAFCNWVYYEFEINLSNNLPTRAEGDEQTKKTNQFIKKSFKANTWGRQEVMLGTKREWPYSIGLLFIIKTCWSLVTALLCFGISSNITLNDNIQSMCWFKNILKRYWYQISITIGCRHASYLKQILLFIVLYQFHWQYCLYMKRHVIHESLDSTVQPCLIKHILDCIFPW